MTRAILTAAALMVATAGTAGAVPMDRPTTVHGAGAYTLVTFAHLPAGAAACRATLRATLRHPAPGGVVETVADSGPRTITFPGCRAGRRTAQITAVLRHGHAPGVYRGRLELWTRLADGRVSRHYAFGTRVVVG